MRHTPIILAGLLAAACNQTPSDPHVCISPAVAEVAAEARRTEALKRPHLTPADREAVERRRTDACLQRWAYRLRTSPAGAAQMRAAVLGACETELAASRTALTDPATPMDLDAWAIRRAAFFIVQAQAGRCPAPKV